LASSTLPLRRKARRWAIFRPFGSSNSEAKISLQRRIAGSRTPSAVQASESCVMATSIEDKRVCWRGDLGHLLVHGDRVAIRGAELAAGEPDGLMQLW
jgi:hypothetical protein